MSWVEVGGVKCFQISKVFGLRDIWVLMRTPIETKHQKDVHVASWFHEWNGFPWDAACIDPTLVSEFWKWSRFIVLREDPPAHYLWVVIVFGVWWLHHYFVLATLVASTNPLRAACSKRCGPPWCDMPSFSYTSFCFSLTLKHKFVTTMWFSFSSDLDGSSPRIFFCSVALAFRCFRSITQNVFEHHYPGLSDPF